MRRAAIATAALCAAGLAAGGAFLAVNGGGDRVTGHPSPLLARDAAAAPAGNAAPASRSIVPLHFEQNVGQAPADVRFLARGGGSGDALLGADGVTIGDLRLALDRAVRAAAIEGAAPLAARIDSFVGPRSEWRTSIPAFGEVLYRGVYPGIDLRYHGTLGALEHDFVVAPGADPSAIGLLLEGSRSAHLDGGDLVVATANGEARLKAPFAYQEVDGQRVAVPARFVLDGDRVSFGLGGYDASRELVIDPVLLYKGYLGGAGSDTGTALATDAAGNVYATGRAGNDSTAMLPGATDPSTTSNDAYVAKVDPTKTGAASLVYAAYVGGAGNDVGYGLAVDAAGVIYLVGDTDSTAGIATTGSYSETAGGGDGFLAKIDPSKSGAAALVYATYVGGSGTDSARAVALDPAGNTYVVGTTASAIANTFPLKNELDGAIGGGQDAFLVKLDTRVAGTAALLYGTYLGGDGNEEGLGLAVDAAGKAVVAGETNSAANFPTKNALRTTLGGTQDAYLLQLDTTQAGAASQLYGTYLGGTGNESVSNSSGGKVALTPSGLAVVVGDTGSTDFPTTGGFDTQLGGTGDAFVAKLNPGASGTASLVWGTYLGGTGGDGADGVATDRAGNVFVTGSTVSTDFPTTPDRLDTDKAETDAYLAKISESAAGAPGLLYASYDSGDVGTVQKFDRGLAVAIDAFGRATITGETFSSDIAAAAKGGNGFDVTCGTNGDCDGGANADGWLTTTAFRADLSVTATLPATAKPNTAITLALTVANAGADVATGVAVASTIPAGVTIGTPTASQGTCSTAGQVVTCTLGQLASAGSATVSIPLTPTQVGALPTTSTATAVEGDPNGANNTGAAQSTISANGTVGDPPGGGDTTGPAVTIGKAGTLRLDDKGRVTVTITCPASEQSGPCTGTVGLKSKAKLDPARILSAKRIVSLGSAKYTLAAGKKLGVKVKLNATGRALVKELGSLKAVVTVVAKDAKGNRKTVTKTVTLKPKLAKKPI